MRALLALAILAGFLIPGCTDTGGGDGTSAGGVLPGGAESKGCNEFLGLGEAHRIREPTVVIETSFGVIEAEICQSMVPITGGNFLNLTKKGYFDGQRFHRIIGKSVDWPEGFMMQGGDPNSKDDNPGNDGQGGPGYRIADEFHPRLRHSRSGILSMANSGPNSGGSQFFVTFAPTPHLDGKHAVFGVVTKGYDVLRKIRDEAASKALNGVPPAKEVKLERATVREAGAQPDAPTDFRVWSPAPEHSVPEAGGRTRFVVAVENRGPRPLEATATVRAGEGATAAIEPGHGAFVLPATRGHAFTVEVNLSAQAAGPVEATVNVTAGGASRELRLTVEPSAAVGPARVQRGQQVEAHYIGLTPEGFVFDTSVEEVAKDVAERHLGMVGVFRLRPQYDTFTFTPGSGVIEGFTDLAVGMPYGGQDAARVPRAKAYGPDPSSPLSKLDLLFELQIQPKASA
jgi:cyclophilin family peptidyl-prolyl cis-trans isomerase